MQCICADLYTPVPVYALCTMSTDSQGSPINDDVDNDDADSDVEAQHLDGGARKRRRSKQAWSMLPVHTPDPKVKIALSLYKVQQNIYLLDFQRVEVRGRSVPVGWVSVVLCTERTRQCVAPDALGRRSDGFPTWLLCDSACFVMLPVSPLSILDTG